MGLYGFLFCGVDLFHSDGCEGRIPGHAASQETCPACMFKAGANSTEPVYADLILPTTTTWLVVFPCHAAQQASEPACILFLVMASS